MFSNFLESLYDGIGDDDDAADDDEDNNNENTPKSSTERHDFERNAVRLSPEEEAQARGVKDDLTELGHTLTRQFRGVANFLAPLPDGSSSSDLSNNPRFNQSRSSDFESNQSRSSDLRVYQSRSSDRDESCVGSDTPETGIRFRSWDLEEKVVEGNDPEEEEEEEEDTEDEEEEEIAAVALTDEVLAFARNIAMHPETWLDFPLDPDEDLDDLEMSDAQRGHALAIERLAPRLAALRIELCPCHMSVGYFWKVYFVLLLSRLNKHDAHLLSSPQVMEARALWMKELQNQTKSSKEGRDKILEEDITPSTSNYYNHAPPEFLSPRIYAFEPPSIMYRDYEHGSENAQFIDKAVIEEKPIQKNDKNSANLSQTSKDVDDDDDDWPEEEDSANSWAPMFTVNEDDVSFSDLEGDDDISSLALKSKITSKGTDQKGT
ncbi:BSD domain [Arabidopsis suecica]|uniref:BSD domain n=1 Tax=Arabidopsis suecica TaxID=45249 RepID=A0A8T2H151_ARASU|nr:BSD domain [Arabidopsis suecica]